jgi:hypothetical protein
VWKGPQPSIADVWKGPGLGTADVWKGPGLGTAYDFRGPGNPVCGYTGMQLCEKWSVRQEISHSKRNVAHCHTPPPYGSVEGRGDQGFGGRGPVVWGLGGPLVGGRGETGGIGCWGGIHWTLRIPIIVSTREGGQYVLVLIYKLEWDFFPVVWINPICMVSRACNTRI